jgi:hypothetical protein
MTSERHQMLAGLDSRKFAALIRQILADIAAHAIGAPIARVLTQPRSTPVIENPEPITSSIFAQARWKAELTNSILQCVSEEF